MRPSEASGRDLPLAFISLMRSQTSSSIGPSFSPRHAATRPTAVTWFCCASVSAFCTGSGSTKPYFGELVW